MNPNELYQRTPEKIDKDLGRLVGCRFNHVPEIEDDNWNNWTAEDITNNDRVEIHYYKNFNFDYKRFWLLAGVKFDDEFVMIIQNAGRDGDDYVDRFITNKSAYDAMVPYLKSLLITPIIDRSADDVVDGEQEIKSLNDFYGNQLDGYFGKY